MSIYANNARSVYSNMQKCRFHISNAPFSAIMNIMAKLQYKHGMTTAEAAMHLHYVQYLMTERKRFQCSPYNFCIATKVAVV